MVQLFVYHLTRWYKFMMDNAFPIKKYKQEHLQLRPTHPCFFGSRRPCPHPLQRSHLGFNIIPINLCLISCYDVLKKVFITICIGKQFLTDFNTVLFLTISQTPSQNKHARTHTNTHTSTCLHAHMHTHMCMRTCTHVRAHTHARAHTHSLSLVVLQPLSLSLCH